MKKYPVLACLAGALLISSLARGEYWQSVDSFKPAIESPEQNVSAGIAAMPGGKVLVTSHPGIINGQAISARMVRLNADGTIDNTFTSPSGGHVLATYSDGRFLLVTQPVSGFSASVIQRCLADGSPDATFTAVTIDYDLFSGMILSDGRLLVYGNGIRNVAGVNRRSIAIVNTDGSLDTTFQSPFSTDTSIHAVTPTADGLHFILSGQGLNLGTGRAYVARLNLDGTVDSSFAATDTTFPWNPSSIYPEADGSVLVTTVIGDIFRLTSAGLHDNAFVAAVVGDASSFGSRQADGKIFYRTTVNVGNQTTTQLRRMNPDGTDDATFPAISTPYASSYQVGLPLVGDDGTLWLGPVTAERYAARFAVSHVLVDGSIDPAFHPRFAHHGTVFAYARQSDGKHVIAGRFDRINDVALPEQYNVARLNADGSLDSGFTSSVSSVNTVTGLAAQPDGKILVYGSFPKAGGGTDLVIRVTSTGASDGSFQSIPTGAVYSGGLTTDSAGYLYGVTSASQVVRYQPNGIPDPTFQSTPFATESVLRIVPLDTGAILVVLSDANFSVSIVRMLHDGSIDSGYAPVNAFGYVTLAALPSGQALKVTRLTGGPAGYFVYERLTASGAVDYTYVGRPSFNSGVGTEVVMASAGVLFDLLKEAAGGGSAAGDLVFDSSGTIELGVRTNGELLIHSEGGIPLQRFQRTALTSPSVDGAPVIAQFSPTTPPLLRPVNWSQTFSVVASGLAPFTYQWIKDGTPMPGKTASSLRLRPVQVLDEGSYAVQITNDFGSVTSPAIAMTVDTAQSSAAIVSPPTGQTVPLGTNAAFTVTASGTPAPTYQWTFNGASIPGATGSTLIVNNVQSANVGAYAVRVSNTVSNASGNFNLTVQSGEALLTIWSAGAPSITQHPVDQTVLAGNPVTFTAAASGDPAPTYQWQRNGADIAGATSSSYTIANPTLAEGGLYRVVATNAAGTAVSNSATLTVHYLPTISIQPQSQTVIVGNSVTFTVGGSGIPIPTWQWRKDGVNIPGAIGLSYTIPNVARSDAGSYTAVATSAAGTAVSDAAVLTVQYAPVFTAQPPTHFVTVGANVPLSVTVDANPAATYQWKKDGADIPGATTATYTISNAQLGDTASYTVVATNSVGSTTSNAAALTVTVASLTPVPNDFNNDGKPDLVWRNNRTGAIAFWLMNGTAMQAATVVGAVTADWSIAGTGDFNNDGQTDLLWRKASSGAVAVWLMNGTAMQSSVNIANITADWRIDGTGDFNGDGKVDILWRKDSSGAVALWLMDGTTIQSTPIIANITYDWIIGGTGDFNGDGKVDILWRKESTGAVAFWLMDGMTILSTPIVANITADWKIAGSGDYNADGETDIIWRKESTGLVAFWLMNDTAVQSTPIVGTITADWVICN